MMRHSLSFLLLGFFLNGFAQQQWIAATATAYQRQLDVEYANLKESPLEPTDLKTFHGLDFYPVSEKFAVQAHFIKSEKEKVFKMKTTGSRLPEYVKYGELHFTIDGKKLKLNVYQNVELISKPGFEDYLFLPFSDLTCGKESYIGGRYIDMKIPKGNTMLIDFNTAYNPYCAYNHNYSCPVVPLENDLDIEIKAGVKKFHD